MQDRADPGMSTCSAGATPSKTPGSSKEWEAIDEQGWCYVRGALSKECVDGFRKQLWRNIPIAFGAGACEGNKESWPGARSRSTGRGWVFSPHSAIPISAWGGG